MQANGPTFEEWYRTTYPGLAEMVERAVSRSDVAGDATDEAFARAFANWERVQSMASPSGWVYRVAVNAARRQLSRARVETEKLHLGVARQSTPPPGGETWLLVAQLPVRQRTAVVLRHVAGFTEADVATAMGVTRSTVSSTLASAYKTLCRELGGEPNERKQMSTGLNLAVATRCDSEGCAIEQLDGGSALNARYSDAVRGAIKIRPGDLVAVDPTTTPPEIVWRWWIGEVVRVDGEVATLSRNVTQQSPADPRRAEMEAEVPDEFVGSLAPGDRVWFGTEDDRMVVVAVATPESTRRVRDRLPDLQAALRARSDNDG